MSEPVGYVFEPSDYEALRAAGKLLFGDGTHLTADQRRDLANMMHETLGRAMLYVKDDKQDRFIKEIVAQFQAVDIKFTTLKSQLQDLSWELGRIMTRVNSLKTFRVENK